MSAVEINTISYIDIALLLLLYSLLVPLYKIKAWYVLNRGINAKVVSANNKV